MARFRWSKTAFRVWAVMFAVITVLQLAQVGMLISQRGPAQPDVNSREFDAYAANVVSGVYRERAAVEEEIEDAFINWVGMVVIASLAVHAVVWIRRGGRERPSSPGDQAS